MLKVIVLDKKTVRVDIRPVQVRQGKQLVSLGNAADPKKLLNEMNAICCLFLNYLGALYPRNGSAIG